MLDEVNKAVVAKVSIINEQTVYIQPWEIDASWLVQRPSEAGGLRAEADRSFFRRYISLMPMLRPAEYLLNNISSDFSTAGDTSNLFILGADILANFFISQTSLTFTYLHWALGHSGNGVISGCNRAEASILGMNIWQCWTRFKAGDDVRTLWRISDR